MKLYALALVMITYIVVASAQQTSNTERIKGQPTTNVMVRAGEVVAVEGNNLILKMEDGEVKHFNVPPDSKFTVDGKEVGLSELKPGTALTQSLMTTTTPTVVRTTTTIKGRVFHVSPPTSVILTLANGENKKYYIPEGQKINVNGQQLDAYSLQKGMNIDATVTQEVAEEDVEVRRGSVTGVAPAEPAAEEPATVAQNTQPEPAPAPAEPPAAAPAEPAAAQESLPQTATLLPLLGILGGGLTLAGWITRKRK